MSYADNPRASGNPPSSVQQEDVGPVASDSLAAESLRSGGDFADGNAVASSQKGASSTFNTTDTSGAEVLHAASSAETRSDQDAKGLGSDEKGPGGLKYPEAGGNPEFTGSHNLDGYTGGPSADQPSSGYTTQPAGASDFGSSTLKSSEPDSEIKSSSNTDADPGSVKPPSSDSGALSTGAGPKGATSTAATSTSATSSDGPSTGTSSDGPSTSTGVRPKVDEAPTYAARVADGVEDDKKPKGENLTEGDIPQTKTFTGDVGGPHDPGRLAEQKFEQTNANDAIGGTGEARDTGSGGNNPYDALGGSTRA